MAGQTVTSGWVRRTGDTDQDFTGLTYPRTGGTTVRVVERAESHGVGNPNHWWVVEDQTTRERWQVPSYILASRAGGAE